MSYELKIWSRRAPDEEPTLPRIADHLFSAAATRAVGMEDIPTDILLTSPGLSYLTVLTLEPWPPSDSARGYALKYAQKLASELDGVVENSHPGADAERLTCLCGRYLFPPVNEYTEMLQLSVWFRPDRPIGALADRLISVFEEYFPYALPLRYGSAEPPEFSYSETGREHLRAFLQSETCPVWYAVPPATHVYIRDAASNEIPGSEYRANCITLQIPDKIYDYPEWNFALRRLLRQLAVVCDAFFGQIVRGRGGVSSWWWRGIPMNLGAACVIGGEYYPLIPDCAAKGTEIGDGMAYFEEPIGPYIPSELISKEKKRLFGKRSAHMYKEDFTMAEKLPVCGSNGRE